ATRQDALRRQRHMYVMSSRGGCRIARGPRLESNRDVAPFRGTASVARRARRRNYSRESVLPRSDKRWRDSNRKASQSGFLHLAGSRRQGRKAEVVQQIGSARIRLRRQFTDAFL